VLNAAGLIEDLVKLPGNKFENLTKTKPGFSSIWIND